MPAAVASRTRDQSSQSSTARRGPQPPAKKTKLSQPPAASRHNGLQSLLNGSAGKKQPVQAKTNGVKRSRKERVDEATAVVGGALAGNGDVDMEHDGKEVIEISSGVEESDYSGGDDDDDDDDEQNPPPTAQEEEGAPTTAPAVNGEVHDEDRPVEDGPAESGELSFGERLQAQALHVVDVEATFDRANAESRALATASNSRSLAPPSASSLGTVLTQALRTNDQELLESCLKVIDMDTIYATVERLPSPLVGNLLQKLAEHLHKKPGRAGMLMVWVQWSLAAHGGYLASQPQLVKQLATLTKVLKERASGLQPLLALKGRLDMIHAQLELRRRNQKRAAHDEDDEAVVYVEGEDDFTSAEEDNESVTGSDAAAGVARKRMRRDSDGEDTSSVDEMPTTMEVDEDDSEEGSEDSEGLVDDEAEETDNDSGEEMSEPMSDDEADAEDASASEGESKPARRSTVSRAGLARRF
ncbi:Dip2/Utp12 family-domain-containing protein [Clohesyomyces aquaticus]|uniref:Dip2/Utp12 family-domain-containing protein n=1 Tax=Clohesyomyces aquaticus TaxID=1231657 RepID=A0A1Y1ZP97_9PLEO|nr:Dip2/Utp12 family-domain-containing protein [Clohesyomyces aquaticus]